MTKIYDIIATLKNEIAVIGGQGTVVPDLVSKSLLDKMSGELGYVFSRVFIFGGI